LTAKANWTSKKQSLANIRSRCTTEVEDTPSGWVTERLQKMHQFCEMDDSFRSKANDDHRSNATGHDGQLTGCPIHCPSKPFVAFGNVLKSEFCEPENSV
jgi:hypothetical protein